MSSFFVEIGHNLGGLHDKGAMNACENPNYNYAYRDPQGDFRTILAYNCKTNQCDENEANSCPRIMRFSTSDFANYNYNGKPLGTAEIDNARQFNEVRAAIAMCKTHVGTPPPTQLPSMIPTIAPTIGPTSSPTISPTSPPTSDPTSDPTSGPTSSPSLEPSVGPSSSPSLEPTLGPTNGPTFGPTGGPTGGPTRGPTTSPSTRPTLVHSTAPTIPPTLSPTASPTSGPTSALTSAPTYGPTSEPTAGSTACPWVVNPLEQSASCPTDGDPILTYVGNDNNAPPPNHVIHSVSFNPEYGSVSFKVANPFGDDVHDIFVIYDKPSYLLPEANGDTTCAGFPEQESCPNQHEFEAKCLNNGSHYEYTVITVYVIGQGAQNTVVNGTLSDIYDCCPIDAESLETPGVGLASYTYVLNCCPEDEVGQRRLLSRNPRQFDILSGFKLDL